MANVRLARWDWVQDGCPSVLARGRHHSLLLLASVLLLSTVSRGLLVPGGSLLGSALPGKDEAGRQSEQGQRQRPPRSHPRHCAEYLARGPSLPLRGGGKNNNVLAKKVGAAGSAFISTKKKALFPASPQRLFITHTRVWRKCSICWVQPSAHTAYKLRAFTCRVPEIKHTHTHTKERGALERPRRSCLSLTVSAPRPRQALALVQEFHIISERFQLPQQGTALLLSSCSHIWNVLHQGVSRQGPAAGMRSPRRRSRPALPGELRGRLVPASSFRGGFGGAFVAATGLGRRRSGSGDPRGAPRDDAGVLELPRAGMLCCGPRLGRLRGGSGERSEGSPVAQHFGSWPFWDDKMHIPGAATPQGLGAVKSQGLKEGAPGAVCWAGENGAVPQRCRRVSGDC